MRKKALDISERIIEDVLVLDKRLLANILEVSLDELTLLARQKRLDSGVLDLLYVYQEELLLIELKVVSFYDDIVRQINDYEKDLKKLQEEKKLIDTPIKKYIFVTNYRKKDKEKCVSHDIELKTINPTDILYEYHIDFKELSQFLTIKSGDYGVVRIGLINSTLQYLGKGLSLKLITKEENRSIKTIRNRISVATQLGLVIKHKHKDKFFLTELGVTFTKANPEIDDFITEEQVDILYSHLKDNPLSSSIAYTIFSIVESVFILSKSTYPIPFETLKNYFVRTVGKTDTWKTEKAKETATYIFSNYATELELLSKLNKEFFITPKGIQAVLLFQLNRSIKLIETKSLIG
jgi:predicted transcriptional regulator